MFDRLKYADKVFTMHLMRRMQDLPILLPSFTSLCGHLLHMRYYCVHAVDTCCICNTIVCMLSATEMSQHT